MTDPKEDFLDDLFAQARAVSTAPDEGLVARVLADAARAPDARSRPVVPRKGPWARGLDALGGWPVLGGFVAATAVGLWIGIAPPAGVEDVAASLIGDTVSVPLFSADAFEALGDMSDG